MPETATTDADFAAIAAEGAIRTKYVVVCDETLAGSEGDRRVCGLCNRRPDAIVVARIHLDQNPQIYQRGRRKRWIQAR